MQNKILARKSSLRLKGFDYSFECLYYITICVFHYFELFGKIIEDKMHLNDIGNFVRNELFETENYYNTVAIDEYVIMPNHIHVILFISNDEANLKFVKQNRIETEILRVMEYHSDEKCRGLIHQTRNKTQKFYDSDEKCRGLIHQTQKKSPIEPEKGSINRTPTLGNIIRHFKASTAYQLHIQGIKNFKWQRNFHDHIIRNDKDYYFIKNYIINNPANWSNESKNQDYYLR